MNRDGEVVVVVADNGMGIGPEFQERILGCSSAHTAGTIRVPVSDWRSARRLWRGMAADLGGVRSPGKGSDFNLRRMGELSELSSQLEKNRDVAFSKNAVIYGAGGATGSAVAEAYSCRKGRDSLPRRPHLSPSWTRSQRRSDWNE